MKKIETLIPDIEQLITEGRKEIDAGKVFGERACSILERGLYPRDDDAPSRVWFSNVGGPCTRKLWYKIHAPTEAEPLLPHTRIKFLYGDILEELLLGLAREAGHVVEGEQERVEYLGITGRIDAIIDGVLVDVKSASSYAFTKFRGGLRADDDSFGYLGQLAGYLLALRDTGRVERNRAAFFAIDKQTGKTCLDIHEWTDEELDEHRRLLESKRDAGQAADAPVRAFDDIPDGKSGNRKLGVNCSYCDFKHTCWPGLRMFAYAGRSPVLLTHVEREPNVPEILKGTEDDDTS